MYCHQRPLTTALIEWQSRRRRARSSSRADVPHVEVDHVLRIGPLHRNGEGFKWVESEGDQASDRVVYRAAQQARLDLELQQARVSRVKPGGGVCGGDTEKGGTMKFCIQDAGLHRQYVSIMIFLRTR